MQKFQFFEIFEGTLYMKSVSMPLMAPTMDFTIRFPKLLKLGDVYKLYIMRNFEVRWNTKLFQAIYSLQICDIYQANMSQNLCILSLRYSQLANPLFYRNFI